MFLIIEIVLTVLLCNRLHRIGRRWLLGLIPMTYVFVHGKIVADHLVSGQITKAPVLPEIVVIIVLIFMILFIKPSHHRFRKKED